jgi:MFS transporter, PAT family, solute carrier family 33 (acetyl-CoA transportor), member 1
MALRASKSRSPPDSAETTPDSTQTQTPKQGGQAKLPSLVGEGGNIAILLALYFLQGVPIGLAASVPLFLKERVGLSDIATFGFCSWPYALKLLWAPIVDAVFSPSFGRRKTWIVPTQYLAGFMLLLLSSVLDSLLESDPPQILALTAGFFILYFLVATQDIAVDGWALTLLRPENVGYASSCNSIGQTLGYIVAYASFLAGTSAEFCNRFRAEPLADGAVSMATFLQFWGLVFIISTTVLWIFKREDDVRDGDAAPGGLVKAYTDMWSVVKLHNVWWLAVIMVTSKLSYMTEGAVQYELMERGVTRDELLMITMPLVPLEVSCCCGSSCFHTVC